MANNKVEKVLDIKVNYAKAINGIAQYKAKLEELKNTEKIYKEQLKAGTIGREEYNKSISATKILIDDTKASIRDIEKVVKNQIKMENSEKGSLRALRAELSYLTQKYENYSDAKKADEKVGGALSKQINDLTNKINSEEQAIQKYYRNVGNYENSIKNALGLNNEFADSILNLSENGKGLKGMFDNAKTSAAAFGKTLLGLLTNPVFLALAGIAGVGMAFKWFYE